MSCLAGSSHYSVALLEARLLVCIPGGLASFHPGSSPWPSPRRCRAGAFRAPKRLGSRRAALSFCGGRVPAYLYFRFQVSKGCKRRSLAVMSGTRITRIPLDPMALRGGYLAGRRGITDEANPYQAGAPAALAWRIGWVSGLKKQLRVMYGGRSVFTGRFRTRPFLSSQ